MKERTLDSIDHVKSLHPVWMEMDLAVLEENFHEIRHRVGPAKKIIASLKGNAYGHGIVELTRTLNDLGAYAVATGSFKDAVAIRKAGLRIKIQMFAGNLPEGVKEYLRYDLIPTIYNMETAQAVSKVAESPVPVYIKVDAGLGRLGVSIDKALPFVQNVASLPNIIIEGIYTHLPFRDAEGRDWARSRIKLFDDLVDAIEKMGIEIPVTQSIASAGIACGTESRCNTVCTGHLLYGGLSRVTPDIGDLSAFRPVLTAIKSRLIHVEYHVTEKTFGMGGKQHLKKGSTTGVIPVGLYDGYRNSAEGKTAVMLIQGQRVPVLNVTLEYTTLDLTGVDNPRVGEEIILLGQSGKEFIALEELADWQNGGPLDVLTSFEGRIPCFYHGARI